MQLIMNVETKRSKIYISKHDLITFYSPTPPPRLHPPITNSYYCYTAIVSSGTKALSTQSVYLHRKSILSLTVTPTVAKYLVRHSSPHTQDRGRRKTVDLSPAQAWTQPTLTVSYISPIVSKRGGRVNEQSGT